MCIRGVPKVYHNGGARTVGVRWGKDGGKPAGMRENRAQATLRAGNHPENAQTEKTRQRNADGNKKKPYRKNPIRLGKEAKQYSFVREES